MSSDGQEVICVRLHAALGALESFRVPSAPQPLTSPRPTEGLTIVTLPLAFTEILVLFYASPPYSFFIFCSFFFCFFFSSFFFSLPQA